MEDTFQKKIPVLAALKSNNLCEHIKFAPLQNVNLIAVKNLPNRKRFGKESRFECSTWRVSLCVYPCFEIYHTQKNYIQYYTDKNLK